MFSPKLLWIIKRFIRWWIIKIKLFTDFNINEIPYVARSKIQQKVVAGPLEMVRVTVREAVRLISVGHGQGFIKCDCKGKCMQSRCSCRTAGLA